MNQKLRRTLSFFLALAMLLSIAPNALANEESTGSSYFDFEASEYQANENDGEIKIRIVRHGDGNTQADVSFKAADFLSEYGTDYAILDEHGKPLEKIYGEKPEMSEFVYNGDGNSTVDTVKPAEETAQPQVSEQAVQTESTEDVQQPAQEAEKKKVSTGSALRDAQTQYLDLPEGTNDEETGSAVKETLDDLYNYFLSAQGAMGFVHFDSGENEKTVTVRIYDNDIAQQDKVFMVALMGTDTEETSTAANATTYVSIADDEETETAYFDLEDSGLTLTSDAPTGYVTIRRSGATQYFATVNVSTVKDTALDKAYESFSDKVVAFVPGETEKKVEVTAYDFSRDAKFGVRLEGESGVEIGNYYIDVAITQQSAAKPEEETEETAQTQEGSVALMSDDISLMSTNVRLGSSSWATINVPGGWKRDVTGDGNAWVADDNIYLKQYDKNKHSMLVSNWALNLIGNKNITFSSYITNPTRGFGTRYQSYKTYFETDSDQSFSGSLNSIGLSGNHNWEERTLGLGNTGDSAYLKLSAQPSSGGYDNVYAIFDWIRFNYAYYGFSAQNSTENFNRKLYDFTQYNPSTNSAPNIYDAYWDGETTRIYNPGTLERAGCFDGITAECVLLKYRC